MCPTARNLTLEPRQSVRAIINEEQYFGELRKMDMQAEHDRGVHPDMPYVLRGEVVWGNPSRGHEQAGDRPVLSLTSRVGWLSSFPSPVHRNV